jgi:hypothetical protein
MTTTPGPSERTAAMDDFVPTEELVRRQGIGPLRSVDDLAVDDPFGSDAEYEAFLADLHASRRSSST